MFFFIFLYIYKYIVSKKNFNYNIIKICNKKKNLILYVKFFSKLKKKEIYDVYIFI